MPRSCRFGRRRIVCWIIFSLIATSLCLAQNKAAGKLAPRGSVSTVATSTRTTRTPTASRTKRRHRRLATPTARPPIRTSSSAAARWNVTGLFTNNLSQLDSDLAATGKSASAFLKVTAEP